MILRKPYAFLIKHFKIIHFSMFLGIVYSLFQTWNVVNFFNSYMSSGQVIHTYEDISGIYINALFLLIVSFLIVTTAIVLYLMRHKKKPSLFYVFMLISYSLFLILLMFGSNFLYNIQFSTPDLRVTKIVRDIFFAFFIVQFPSLIVTLVRAVGFDVKKFDFKKDLLELDISQEDNEEFEVQLGIDSEDIKSKVRKKIRYFKYYYMENRFLFIGAFAAVGVFLIIFTGRKLSSIEKKYSEMEWFETRSMEVMVLDSYKLTTDYKGKKISDDSFYVVLKLRFKNKTDEDFELNIENTRLNYTEYHSSAPLKLLYGKFVEFGTPYYSQTLHGLETRDFVFVYEVPIDYYYAKLQFKYLYNLEVVNGQVAYRYRIVNLKPKTFDDDSKVMDTKKLGEELNFTGSLLGNTKLTIQSIDLSNQYTYDVVRCKNGVCDRYVNFLTPEPNNVYDTTLMRIRYQLTFDNRIGQNYSIDEFIAKFGTIRFVLNGKEYHHKMELKDITPYTTDGYAYLEVRSRLTQAEKIYLDFTIRDKVYTYVIKDDSWNYSEEDHNNDEENVLEQEAEEEEKMEDSDSVLNGGF